MCGRFTLRAPASVIAEQFALFELPLFMRRFNIAPTQPVPVVRMQPATVAAGPGEGLSAARREFVLLRWGLIPSWAKEPSIGNRMINARAETVSEKPAYRAAFRRRRCLVVADGFYEWQRAGRARQPYFIRMRDDSPFAFAALWEAWEGADHSYIESCTILTTEPNDLMRPIHDRMPVILPPEHYAAWLDPACEDAASLQPLLRPNPADVMRAEPVSTYVNNPKHDDSRCIERQRELF